MKFFLTIPIFILLRSECISQANLTLDSCLYLARLHYPSFQQIELSQKILGQQIKNINTNWLPGIQGTAQATYQSDVTSIPINIPGLPTITPPPKDQYKFYLDAQQLIYDGGTNKNQKNLLRNVEAADELKVESEFYKMNEKVIQLYFGILLIKEQIKIIGLTQSDVDANLKKAGIAYEAKSISGYQLNLLKSEKIKLDQKLLELQSQQKVLLTNLGKIIHRILKENEILTIPQSIPINSNVNRPEFKLIQVQKALLQQQNRLNQSKAIPKVLAFGQAGYSNPALNFLKDEFQTYYIAGIRLNWNVSSLYNLNRDNKINHLNQSLTEIQEEAFLYKLNIEKSQYEIDTEKFLALQLSDQDLILLYSKIKEASRLQYETGTLTLADYLRDINSEEQARLNEVIHRISYLQSIYLNNNLYGNQK